MYYHLKLLNWPPPQGTSFLLPGKGVEEVTESAR